MALKVAWLTNTSLASGATSASQAPVAMPALPAFFMAGARAFGSLAATVMAPHCCWMNCSIICDWSASLAPFSEALKYGIPTSLGIMQILAGPPPPPCCDGCWPTPHETAAATSAASMTTQSTFLVEPNTLLLLPQAFLPETQTDANRACSTPRPCGKTRSGTLRLGAGRRG